MYDVIPHSINRQKFIMSAAFKNNNFRHRMRIIMNIVFNNGINISAASLELSILTSRATYNMASIFGKIEARQTARDVPRILKVTESGYMRMANVDNTRSCNCTNIWGLPILKNTGPAVEPIDLVAPQKANTCMAGTIGSHLSPMTI